MTMSSITYRITGLMFLSICLTVVLLVYLANLQMEMEFATYLTHQAGAHGLMGGAEQAFLESTHRSLLWVGAAILAVGLLASYWLAQSITVPLRRLNGAVDAMTRGRYGEQVVVSSDDEVGNLALAFNRMSQSLADNAEQRQRFLADVAHELKTPLAVIQGNLEGMLDGVIDASPEQLSSLYEETVHLNRLIRDLRDLSLAEAGQLRLEKEAADLNALLERAMHMLQPLMEEKGLVLEQYLAALPPLKLDIGRINQIIYNLLTNALRYTVAGTIRVSSGRQQTGGQEWAFFEVEDSGQGIAAADLPFVFDHFYRADRSRAKASGGSGIGLSIVKQLAEVHGGWVEAQSSEGAGSRFRVYLPLGR